MRPLLAGLLCVACSLGARAQAEPTPDTTAAAQAPPDADAPRLSLRIRPEGDVHVGDPIQVKLAVDAPAGTQVRVPSQDLAPFEVVQRQTLPVEELQGGRERHPFELTLMYLEPGEVTLPALDVRVVTPDGTVDSLHTEPHDVHVVSRVGNEPNAAPRDATPPVEVLEDDYTVAWVAGGLLAAALLVALGYAYARRRANRAPAAPPPAPARPPWEVALEQLDRLAREREHWLNEGRAVDYVDRVSDVARAYLGDRYGFDGLESTTDEVVAALSARRHPELPMTDVVTLLSDCDLVKFAKAAPDAALCESVHAQARKMVEGSRPRGPAQGEVDDATGGGQP